MLEIKNLDYEVNNCDVLAITMKAVQAFMGIHSIIYDVQFKLEHINYIIICQTQKKSMKAKARNDGDFSPNEINKRYKYKRITEKLKDKLAKLYFLQNVKMSKMVKKYKISFSTLTDIFKRYNGHGERLPSSFSKATQPVRESTLESHDSQTANIQVLEIESRYAAEVLKQENPEYIYYDSYLAVYQGPYCE